MLTGDPITGDEAALIGLANRAFPPDELEERVLAIAGRIADIPKDLTQINKRSVHRSFDIMGARAAMRAGDGAAGAGRLQRSRQGGARGHHGRG